MALGLRVEAPKGQVDAWASIMVLLRHLMLDEAQRNFLNDQAFDLLTLLGWLSSPGTRFLILLLVQTDTRTHW